MAPTFGLRLPLGDGRRATRLQDPFNDETSGRTLTSDTFTPITVNPQRLTPTSAPFMYLSMTPVPSSTHLGILGAFSLGSGSVWIAAKQFAPDAPDSSYFGLQIDSGGLRFSNPLFNTGDPFAQVSLTITSTTATGLLRDASVAVPINVDFQFNLSNATLLSASNGNVNIWGTPVALQYQSGQAFMDATFDRLNFPFLPAVNSFQAIQSTSSLAKFSGTAPIHSGSWCLSLSTTSTATFGEASGGGGMSITLDPGISVIPLDRSNATACGAFSCLVEPSLLSVQGASATTSTLPQMITLPLGSTTASTPRQPQSTLTLRTLTVSPFEYTAQIDGTEGWAIFISVSASLDKPRTISGARGLMGGQGVLNFIRNGLTGLITATLQVGQAEIGIERNFQSQSQAFALKNLLLQTGIQRSLNVNGTYVGGSITAGTLAFTSALLFVQPFLPDPYATNISNATNIDGSLGDMTISVTWDADPTHEPVFDLSLPPSALRRVGVLSTDPQVTRMQQDLIQQNLALTPEGPILLDLSTNVSQFGVSFSKDQQENPIVDLSLQGQATNIQVFALPAVHWEPMVAQPSGDTYNFIYSGPPTMVASNSVSLVPVAPREAMDEILNSYSTSTSAVVTASFSLPFGLVAATTLQHSPLLSQPSFKVLPVKPVFQNPPAIGGDQISLRVVPSLFLGTNSPTTSLTLPGSSRVLSTVNIQSSDPSLPVVIGSAIDTDSSSTFISDSYDSAFTSSVPVNRVDLSGFGESIFSEWQTGTTDQIGITKVSFDVMFGRTAREVIQVRSVMAPYAHRVIRTITIDRLNNGIVVRSDSGWQPITDGTYDFPVNLAHPIVTHPGVVTKATNVRNIRDIINTETPGLVNFDCTLVLENSLGPVETPAINQLGFVYEGDSMGNPATFLPADYAAILAKAPLGGPVDVNIDIGGSGMQMRITKISIAATSTLNAQGDPEFCVAANGAPVLPGGGQWSFIRTTPLLASTPVDKDQGVPLTRRGPHTNPIPPTNPYKFADPSDILSDVAQINYGILHATDSHRTLFSKPIINAEAAVKSITSELLPGGGIPSIYIADPFALGSSSSIFPDLGNCIPLINEVNPALNAVNPAIFNLKILAENNLHLDDIQNFALPAATRILQGDDNFKNAILTAGAIKDAVPASVNLLLNSAEKTWNMDVSKLSMLNLGQGGAEISRIAGSIQSAESQLMAFGSGLASDLSNVPQLIFGAALQEVQKVVAFLSSLGVLPALKVAMTNTWALTVSTSMGLDEFLAKIPPGARDVVADIITEFDLALKAVTSLTSADFKFTLKLGVKVPTSFGPTALGIAGFSLDVGTSSGVAVRLDLGVGIGVGFDAGPFHALGYFGYTQSVYKAPNAWGLGSTATVKAHVDLVVATADLCIEATIALVSGTCNNGDEESTIWGYAQVTIAIDVSIFWVVNVHVHEHAEWNNRFKGHCELVDLTHGV